MSADHEASPRWLLPVHASALGATYCSAKDHFVALTHRL
jgi:hypothetical protein